MTDLEDLTADLSSLNLLTLITFENMENELLFET